VNYRPEYQHTWSGKTYYSQMRLDALPAESAGELLEALLGDDPGLVPLKHALTHEVTYSGLLQERRRELHARIVDAIETLHQERLAEHIDGLAHHAVRGELREKAVEYLRQAGLKAAARSALPDARVWFEQALGVLEVLPESPSTLEQAFEIRLELRPVLVQLGEVRGARQRLREAEALAERLNDDRRRGHVCEFMTVTHSLVGELGEAVVTGTRALEIARRLGDLRLRIVTTSFLGYAHYLRGDYERVIELATDHLAALPPDWVHEFFGSTQPASVLDRLSLVMSLAQLGRFAEAARRPREGGVFGIGLDLRAEATTDVARHTAHALGGDAEDAREVEGHCMDALQRRVKRVALRGGVPAVLRRRRRRRDDDRDGLADVARAVRRERIPRRLCEGRPVNTPSTPATRRAGAGSIATTSAWACGERTNAA
jgi:tetratricopeptide (TPR) repeat protein